MHPAIRWQGDSLRLLDQRRLPRKTVWYVCRGYRDVIRAIQKMVVRGAPAIGIAAAAGLALGAAQIRARSPERFLAQFDHMAAAMRAARPTAVNLAWAVDRMVARARRLAASGDPGAVPSALRREAERILAEDIAVNHRIGQAGLPLIPPRARILTHCNAGALATGGYGTALGVVRAAHAHGLAIQVIADETRPWLQGLRLTAYELQADGIPVTVIVDSAAAALMRQGRIDLVVTGADRIAANGDTANKIGTYGLAVLARAHGIPFYVAAPLATIDPALPTGADIPIEERAPEEITVFAGRRVGPAGASAYNPAFDVTPGELVTAIITEAGILRPPYAEHIRETLRTAGTSDDPQIG